MFRGRSRNHGGNGGYRGGRGRGRRSSGQPARVKGVFADDIWHCNCTPRLPAEHFKVKKAGPNKDRWFYTCQNTQEKRCDFFLWDEDAKHREEAAVLSNSRTEPGARNDREIEGVQEGWHAGRGKGVFAHVHQSGRAVQQRPREDSQETLSASPPPPHSSPSEPRAQGNGGKRNAQDAGFDEDEDKDAFHWPLTGQEEEDIAKAIENAVPQTPRKRQKMGVYDTPVATTERKRKLPWLEESAAPAAARTIDSYFETPSKAPHSAVGLTPVPKTPSAPPTPAYANSPSPPSRYKDALCNPADSSSSLTSEVLAELADIAIAAATREKLRGILSKHDLKTQGIAKGRDISRLALKAKDAKIAELQARIASLEALREVDRGVMRKMRWDRENGRESGGRISRIA